MFGSSPATSGLVLSLEMSNGCLRSKTTFGPETLGPPPYVQRENLVVKAGGRVDRAVLLFSEPGDALSVAREMFFAPGPCLSSRISVCFVRRRVEHVRDSPVAPVHVVGAVFVLPPRWAPCRRHIVLVCVVGLFSSVPGSLVALVPAFLHAYFIFRFVCKSTMPCRRQWARSAAHLVPSRVRSAHRLSRNTATHHQRRFTIQERRLVHAVLDVTAGFRTTQHGASPTTHGRQVPDRRAPPSPCASWIRRPLRLQLPLARPSAARSERARASRVPHPSPGGTSCLSWLLSSTPQRLQGLRPKVVCRNYKHRPRFGIRHVDHPEIATGLCLPESNAGALAARADPR